MRQAGPCWAVSGPGKGDYTKKDTGGSWSVPALTVGTYSSHTLVAPTVETHPSRGAWAGMPGMPLSQSTALSGGLRGLEREEEWEDGVGSGGSWPASSVLTSL